MFLVTLALFVMMVMLVIIKLRMGSVKALASFLVLSLLVRTRSFPLKFTPFSFITMS